MKRKQALSILLLAAGASLVTACGSSSPYAIRPSAAIFEPPPSPRADELVQRAAGGPVGHQVTLTGNDGRYRAEATVIRGYRVDGRTCKDLRKKILFDRKAAEDQEVTVCYRQEANPGWFIIEKGRQDGPQPDRFGYQGAGPLRLLPPIVPMMGEGPYWPAPNFFYPRRLPWLPPRW